MSNQEIKNRIVTLIQSIIDNKECLIDDSTALIGEDKILDSMALVELCLKLEDLALMYDFEFDWTSDEAMSVSRSMFRTLKSLTDEFIRQKQLKGPM